MDHYHLNNNPYTTIVKDSFGQVTHENSMKWDAIEREPSSFFFFPWSEERGGPRLVGGS